eukprot:TRINITY_DN87285_c0_g1_i1.p1 TRINITY_DN87285_c0_g1~~TRINITY_DN87285_c0_g1_i1.p1  ORF type:complete len:207 (-),score=45.69 TRINITY_DN87285_c0_g1_i1:51-647(-)
MAPKLDPLASHDAHLEKLEAESMLKDPKLQAGGRRKKLPKLCDKRLSTLMEAFQSLDADGSGDVSKEELAKSLTAKFPGVDIQALITVFDADHNGRISYTEFGIMSKVLSTFTKFDVNGDGLITREELSTVLAKLGMESTDVSSLLAMFDADKNEQMNVLEFVSYVHGFSEELGMKITETAEILSGEKAIPGVALELS